MSSSKSHIASSFMKKLLPFSDAASADLPLGQLLRLSLFQISVGMATVLLLGTLNRVMIVELGVPATIVAFMVAIPVLIAPFRAALGFKSDHINIWHMSYSIEPHFLTIPVYFICFAGSVCDATSKPHFVII